MAPGKDIRISVVMAAYNAAVTIRRALDACLSQTVLPFEIIVVNDGSEDATQEVLQAYGDAILVISLHENKGPAAARNRGIQAASGNFIAFLDADDYWQPEKIAIVREVLSGRPKVSFLYHDYAGLEDALGRSGDRQPMALSRETGSNVLNGFQLKEVSFPNLLLRNPMATPCVVVQKQKELSFDESMRYLEDYELWLRLAARQKVFHLPLPLTVLGRPVLSPGGQSSHKWAMRKGELRVYTRLALRQKQYLPLLPFLWLYSLAKHALKSMR